jgi:hypothetical protein
VTQCLFHCAPFQEDLERQAAGSSVLGDALRNLFAVYKVSGISEVEVRPRLQEAPKSNNFKRTARVSEKNKRA